MATRCKRDFSISPSSVSKKFNICCFFSDVISSMSLPSSLLLPCQINNLQPIPLKTLSQNRVHKKEQREDSKRMRPLFYLVNLVRGCPKIISWSARDFLVD